MLATTTLNNDQLKAKSKTLSAIAQNDRAIGIIGTAGTGKTYCVSEILKELSEKKIIAIAPTNTAVKQMRKSLMRSGLNRVESMTCAKALNLLPNIGGEGNLEFQEKLDIEENPLGNADIIWIDEASMIDLPTLNRIQDKSNGQLLITLDQWQLPPINNKSIPVMDLLNTTSELTKTERYSSDSHIYQVISRSLQAVKTKEKGFRITDHFPRQTDDYRILSALPSGNPDTNNPIYMLARAYLKGQNTDNHHFVRCICWTNDEVRSVNRMVRSILYNGLTHESDYLPGELLVVTGAVTRDELRPYGKKVVSVTKTLYSTATNLIVESYKKVEVKDNDGNSYQAYELMVYDPDEAFKTTHKVTVLATAEHDRYVAAVNKLKSAMSEEYKKNQKSSVWRLLLGKLQGLQAMVDPIRHSYAITAHCSQGMSLNHVFVNQTNIVKNKYDVDVKNRCLFVAASRAKESIWIF